MLLFCFSSLIQAAGCILEKTQSWNKTISDSCYKLGVI